MNEMSRTIPGHVETTEGLLPYRKHPKLGFDMPVKIIPTRTRVGHLRRPLVNKLGQYVYALPGGGEFVFEDEKL